MWICGEGQLPGLQMVILSLSSYGGERSSIAFYKAPSSWPNYLPNARPPNTISLGIRVSTYEFGGTQVFSPYACILSCFISVQLFATLWAITRQVPLSVGFSRQEYWNGSLCSPPGDLPNPGIKPPSLSLLHWQAGSSPLVPSGKPI